MRSPEEFLEGLRNRSVRTKTVDIIADLRSKSFRIEKPVSTPFVVVAYMALEDTPFLAKQWQRDVPEQFQYINFDANYMFPPLQVMLAEKNLAGQNHAVNIDFDQMVSDIAYTKGATPEQAAVYTAEMRLSQLGTATRLFMADRSGFSTVDYFAYSDEWQGVNLSEKYGELVQTIGEIGAERYKKIYCAVTGKPYIPRV